MQFAYEVVIGAVGQLTQNQSKYWVEGIRHRCRYPIINIPTARTDLRTGIRLVPKGYTFTRGNPRGRSITDDVRWAYRYDRLGIAGGQLVYYPPNSDTPIPMVYEDTGLPPITN